MSRLASGSATRTAASSTEPSSRPTTASDVTADVQRPCMVPPVPGELCARDYGVRPVGGLRPFRGRGRRAPNLRWRHVRGSQRRGRRRGGHLRERCACRGPGGVPPRRHGRRAVAPRRGRQRLERRHGVAGARARTRRRGGGDGPQRRIRGGHQRRGTARRSRPGTAGAQPGRTPRAGLRARPSRRARRTRGGGGRATADRRRRRAGPVDATRAHGPARRRRHGAGCVAGRRHRHAGRGGDRAGGVRADPAHRLGGGVDAADQRRLLGPLRSVGRELLPVLRGDRLPPAGPRRGPDDVLRADGDGRAPRR